ncbi:MAG: hypothetical protein R2854_11235 [Caldilineaceae bacterium]
MVEVLALAGGTLAVGVYNYFARQTTPTRASRQTIVNTIRLHRPVSPVFGQTHPQDRTHAGCSRVDAPDANARRNLQAASLSLGLAATISPAASCNFAAIPTLIYMGIPAARGGLRHLAP